MDGELPDAGGKLSVTAVRYQITDTGSLEGSGREGRLLSISGGWLCL